MAVKLVVKFRSAPIISVSCVCISFYSIRELLSCCTVITVEFLVPSADIIVIITASFSWPNNNFGKEQIIRKQKLYAKYLTTFKNPSVL